MKVQLNPPPIGFPETPHRLFLYAETDKDRELLKRLIDDYWLTNSGHDGTDRWQHVGIELRPLEERDGE